MMATLFSTLVVGLLLLNGMLFFQQPSMIFFPSSDLQQTPQDWGLAYQDVYLSTSDNVRLHGWYIPYPGSDRVVLFFHGNAGNMSHRAESLRIFHRLGLNTLIIDYRGYGRSQGEPDEAGLYRDADSAWQYLTGDRGVSSDKIILFGRSLGGAVAVDLASRVEPAAVILESTFSSARDVARKLLPILSWFVVFRYDLDSVSKISKIHCPLLVLHSPADEIIPFESGVKLFQAGNEPKRLVRLSGDHNSGFLLSQPAYEQTLQVFVDSVFRLSDPPH